MAESGDLGLVNVFVLGTGRCGTVTMSHACSHVRNFTTGHESLAEATGDARFAYPPRHIEIDPRLPWFLGELYARYPTALYVHLIRDPEAVAQSIARRWGGARGFANAFGQAMIYGGDRHASRLDIARFQVRTMTANISLFLDTTLSESMTVQLEEVWDWFPEFWCRIGAVGNMTKAQAEFATHYNASRASTNVTEVT